MNEEKLIQRLNDEVKIKIDKEKEIEQSEKEIEKLEKEIKRLKDDIKQKKYFIEMQDKIIEKIRIDLLKNGE